MKTTLALTVLLAGLAAAPAAVIPFDLAPAGLSPANEVPAVTNSSGSGGEIFGGLSFDTDTRTLSFAIGYGSVAGFSNLTSRAQAMHIHGPAGIGTNAPVLIDLISNHLFAPNPADGGILLGAVVFAEDAASNLLAGLTYINLHTPTNPPGELRAQLVPMTNDAPTLTCPAPLVLECTSRKGALAQLSVEVEDVDGDPLRVVWTVNGVVCQSNYVAGTPPNTTATLVFGAFYDLGTHPVEVSVSDGQAGPTICATSVTVRDSTPPTVKKIKASPDKLNPAHNALRRVNIHVEAHDLCGKVQCRIISVTANEPIDGNGSTDADYRITGPLSLELRSERSGASSRIYTITVECKDMAGNKTLATTQVTVTPEKPSKPTKVKPTKVKKTKAKDKK